MSYFAEIIDNVVVRVIVADSEQWCVEHLGGTWVETADPYSDEPQTVTYCGPGFGHADNLPNLFAPQWVQPVADVEGHWPYNGGEVVWHNGRLWRNVTEGVPNVWEPGVSGWHDAPVDAIPEWVQPTGAHDAYNIGDQVMFAGSAYESVINANVWSPTAYPAGWRKL